MQNNVKSPALFKNAPTVLSGVLLAVALSASASDEVFDEPGFRHAAEAYSEGRFDDARAAFEKLARRFPDNPVVLNNLAVVAVEQGDTDRAVRLLKRAIATDRVIHAGYRNLSAIYAHLASLSYRDALSLDSSRTPPLRLDLLGKPSTETGTAAVAEAAAEAARAKEIREPLVRDPEAQAPSEREREVASAVRRWARAWAHQDTDAYFASYVGEYTPPGESHRDWERKRRERVTAPRRIEVSLSDLHVRMDGEGKARVTFRQKYRSNLLSSLVIKQLDMERVEGEWKIALERVI